MTGSEKSVDDIFGVEVQTALTNWQALHLK